QRLFIASTTRAERGDSNDTREIVKRLGQLRAQRARLLGYPSLAAYVLDDQMAKTPDAAIKLLSDLVPAATAQARREAQKLQAMINKQRGGFKLAPWDWQYYAEQVRKAEYALDETQLEPYFELDRVLKDGVFFAANRLYGLTFKQRTDLPVYHPDVRVFEVFDADGTSLALWYCDYFKRDNKSGGAWEDTFVDGTGLLETRPVVFNVANFTKPAPGQPALLRFDDVKTMFHEFGHALHAMLTRVQYHGLPATTCRRISWSFPRSSTSTGRSSPPCWRTTRSTIRRASRCRGRWSTRSSGPAHSIRGSPPPNTSPPRCWTWRGTPCRWVRSSPTSTRSRRRR